MTYAAACALLRETRPAGYPENAEIVTAFWSDLLASLAIAEVPAVVATVAGRPTLCQLARGLADGWWLVRVTNHFLLLRIADGAARVYDNRVHGAPLSARAHGRCRVTHLAALPAGIRTPPG